MKCYDESIAIDPKNAPVQYKKGFSLQKLERYQEAIKSYDKTLEINPDFEPALKARKDILEAKK